MKQFCALFRADDLANHDSSQDDGPEGILLLHDVGVHSDVVDVPSFTADVHPQRGERTADQSGHDHREWVGAQIRAAVEFWLVDHQRARAPFHFDLLSIRGYGARYVPRKEALR